MFRQNVQFDCGTVACVRSNERVFGCLQSLKSILTSGDADFDTKKSQNGRHFYFSYRNGCVLVYTTRIQTNEFDWM